MTGAEPYELRSARPSVVLRLAKWLIGLRPSVFPDKPEALRAVLASREPPRDAPMPPAFERRFSVERWQCEGRACVTLHPRGGKGALHILYFHGGGFVMPVFKEHWPLVAALVERTGASVTVPLYEVVPEGSHQAADRLADSAFAKLTQNWPPEKIVLAGDSAGGHMALSLALRLGRTGGPQAGRLVLFAPWLDLTLADPAIAAIEPHDVMLRIDALRVMGETWAGGRDPAAPECSPLYASAGDLARLPPTATFQGRHDLFVVDCRSFAARLRDARVAAALYEYEGAPHVYMIVTQSREAKDTFSLVADFVG